MNIRIGLTTLALSTLFVFPMHAEESDATGVIDAATVEAAVAQFGAIHDPIFDQYIDLGELDAAWTYLDAEALAEIGMKLAEAERILFRPHSAVSAQEVLKVAVRTAGVKGKPEVLASLKEFAEKHENRDLLEQAKLASHLAGASRSIAPTLALDQISLGAFIAYKQAELDLDAALVHGNLEMLVDLQRRLDAWAEKDQKIWESLSKEVDAQVKSLEALGAPSRGGPDDMAGATESLNKLSGASRGWPQGHYPGHQPGFHPHHPGVFQGGANFGNQSTTNWQYQQGIRVQNPRAAVVGGLLSGIAGGLNAQNPQKHAVASGVLQGLGQGFIIGSQPSIYQQGQIHQQNQGHFNTWGHFPY